VYLAITHVPGLRKVIKNSFVVNYGSQINPSRSTSVNGDDMALTVMMCHLF